ncbi:hypothetical protein L484_003133 [Morus notabilis]|uniref:Uncharacterized protein n=1 Tax=Morus notabilis TaxID=981085 RepID=W9QZD7_9ROSA|nr:hypothetical protein L484_003133 [Morus notabilis]
MAFYEDFLDPSDLDFSASTAILGWSRENHIEDADGDSPLRTLTRMGEAERWKKVVAEREENLELDEANAEEGKKATRCTESCRIFPTEKGNGVQVRSIF